ncbi:hypothetical protein K4749_23755 [Streptomyces sp. TRM72054]|uniref:DUF6344 domain-containing protein n=1 Tax=Streptomyces sp. TRM72054 TaxID=2870562 RepID=UPI001C8B2FFB|nr:DUF6344 domain-containing protein [Streptomyces sp. TRM72054]MBX9396521.1 hypothetical protein [Streptomyces sp. TRM72054]
MARNKVMNLWNVIVTAFLALLTALGFVTTSASAAVPQTEPARNSTSPRLAVPTMAPWAWAHARTLPPTMKQRIRAEAHGKSPSCRHHPLAENSQTVAAPTTAAAARNDDCDTEPPVIAAGHVSLPLQR